MKAKLIIYVVTLSLAFWSLSKVSACCQDPDASMTVDPTAVVVGCSVEFDATDSSDPDCDTCSSCEGTSMKNGIRKFQWDWTNNGSYDHNETPGDGKADHTYSTTGVKTCKLKVTDDDDDCCCSGSGCDDNTDTTTVTVTVVDLVQFNKDATKFPKCEGDSISRDDFVIVTDPTGYESDVTVSGLTTATSGTHTASAQLCLDGCCSSTLNANYDVAASGNWIPVPASATIPPNPPSGSINESNVSIDYHDDGWGDGDWYKTKVTYTGGYSWDEIGRNTVTAPDTFSTSVSKTWTIAGEVTGTAKVSIPMVAGAEVSVTVGGSWETSTTHSLSSGPDGTPYEWRYTHYQKCWGPSRTIQTWRILDTYDESEQPSENDPLWQSYTETGFSGTTGLSLQGTSTYKQTKEKKCP